MNHDRCKVPLRMVVETVYPPSIAPAEVWFIKHGIEQEVEGWARRNPDVEPLPAESFVMTWERPSAFISGLFGWPVNTVHYHGGFMQLAHVCGHDDGRPQQVRDSPLPQHVQWSAVVWGWVHRQYAMLPLPQRRDVDVDLAEPSGLVRAEAGPPPNVIVLRWRRSLPATRDAQGVIVPWSHRWVVRAHLRRLADGRVVPVREHVKGPDDKPLVLKRKIDYLNRGGA